MIQLLEEFRVRLAPHQLNAWHPRTLSYFTPPPLVASIVGELLTQFTNQGVDVWHAGPSGAFVEEEVGRWLCDLVGYGPGELRRAHLGRGHGQLHGHDRRPRRPPRPGPGARSATPRSPPRGGPGLRLGPDPLLDRPGARRARLPAGDAPSRPGRRAVPAPRRAGRRGGRRGPGGRADPVRDRGRGRLDEHRLGRPDRRAGRCRRARRPVAPRRRGLRRRGAPVGPRCLPRPRPRPGGLDHDRPPQVVLPGLRHRGARGPSRRAAARDVPPQPRVLPRRRGFGRSSRERPGRADEHADDGTAAS